jgi:hypothetical protein
MKKKSRKTSTNKKKSHKTSINHKKKKSFLEQLIHNRTIRTQAGASILANSLSLDALMTADVNTVRDVLGNKKTWIKMDIRTRATTQDKKMPKSGLRTKNMSMSILDSSMRVPQMKRFLQAILKRAIEMKQIELSLVGSFENMYVSQKPLQSLGESFGNLQVAPFPPQSSPKSGISMTFEEQMAAMKV